MRFQPCGRWQVGDSVEALSHVSIASSVGRRHLRGPNVQRVFALGCLLLAWFIRPSAMHGAHAQVEIIGERMKVTWREDDSAVAFHRTPKPNTIVGVVETPDGKPIEGADLYLFRVRLLTDERQLLQQLRSASNGTYQFEKAIAAARGGADLKPNPSASTQDDKLEVVVRSPGCATLAWYFDPKEVAQVGQLWDWGLPTADKLSGRVTAPDGKPVINALVHVQNAAFSSDWRAVNSCRTDWDGRYVIDDLLPFEVRKDGRQKSELINQNWSSSTVTRPLMWVEHPHFAGTLHLVEAVPGTKDVELAAPAACEGQVHYSATNKPASDVRVVAATAIPGPMQATMSDAFLSRMSYRLATRTDPQGHYQFTNLPAGTYDLWAESSGWWCRGVSAVALNSSQTRAITPLTLAKGGMVRIRLVDEQNQKTILATPDVTFKIRPILPALRYRLLAETPWTATNANDRVEFQVPAGKLLVTVNIHQAGNQTGNSFWSPSQVPTVELAEGETKDVDIPLTQRISSTSESTELNDEFLKPFLSESIKGHSDQLLKEPRDFESLAARASSYAALGDLARAKEDNERCLQLSPSGCWEVLVRNNLATILATAPDAKLRDGPRAVQLAKQACALQGTPSPDVLDTLAAAYAEIGDFEQAIRQEEQAIARASEPQQAEYKQWCAKYQQRQPRRRIATPSSVPITSPNTEQHSSP